MKTANPVMVKKIIDNNKEKRKDFQQDRIEIINQTNKAWEEYYKLQKNK